MKTVLPVKIKYRCLEFVSWNVKVNTVALWRGKNGSSCCPPERLMFLVVEVLGTSVIYTFLCHLMLLSPKVVPQWRSSHVSCTTEGAEGQSGEAVLQSWQLETRTFPKAVNIWAVWAICCPSQAYPPLWATPWINRAKTSSPPVLTFTCFHFLVFNQ